MLLFFVQMTDKTNVSFAALQMNQQLGFTAQVYGFGAGVFFLGAFLFEVPSNLILLRVGARRWLARIMITWGFIVVALAWVKTPWNFYTLRFLLGVAEAAPCPASCITSAPGSRSSGAGLAASWLLSTAAIGPMLRRTARDRHHGDARLRGLPGLAVAVHPRGRGHRRGGLIHARLPTDHSTRGGVADPRRADLAQ
jgi:MFS family permease